MNIAWADIFTRFFNKNDIKTDFNQHLVCKRKWKMLSAISKDISLISGYYETMLSLNGLHVSANTLLFNVRIDIRPEWSAVNFAPAFLLDFWLCYIAEYP